MLDSTRTEALNLAIILGDDKLDKHFPLGNGETQQALISTRVKSVSQSRTSKTNQR